jgi:hypothetical protein
MDRRDNTEATNNNHIDMIKKNGLRAKGKKELLKHLEGGRLTHRQAIWAHCIRSWFSIGIKRSGI